MATARTTTDDPGRAARRARAWARRLALQALYQWDVSGGGAAELIAQFAACEEYGRADPEYFARLVAGAVAGAGELDARLAPLLDRGLDRLDPVERSMLRCACFELLHCPEVPAPVTLAEATRLAGRFGTERGCRYVNAVLDRLARELRPPQTAGAGGDGDA